MEYSIMKDLDARIGLPDNINLNKDKAMEQLKQLFEDGALLHRNLAGHEQMLMNEGTFIALVQQHAKKQARILLKQIEVDLCDLEWGGTSNDVNAVDVIRILIKHTDKLNEDSQ